MTVLSVLILPCQVSNAGLPGWVQIKDLKMILHGLLFAWNSFENAKFWVFFSFALIWFSEWLIFTNFVGLIFRPSGRNFIVEELVHLDKFQKKSFSLFQNCFRRPYICRYRIKLTIFLGLQNMFLVQNISELKKSHWPT